ncbi:EAL domain-containing protein [Paenibacillus hexagrammi]|uniref:EAL domain-containing protein n=1 Tax=Paenibacillus hexagrammi TaxID=2908839 RepID=A0ABY3SD38_9BACL|nr:EAL domain-containing protein [Paenibacillus sp. YPD9-1]UJF31912.1 EAL domain-containing protein [Paenibacillus sp. YPD9-1]
MHSLMYPIILQLLPAFVLFYIGIEIYMRNPASKQHSLAMVLFAALSLLYVGDFLVAVLPLNVVSQAFYYIKYPAVFLTIAIGIYFFQAISQYSLRRYWQVLIGTPPLLLMILVLIRPKWIVISILFDGNWREEHFNAPFAMILLAIVVYCFFWIFFFLYAAYKRMKDFQVIIKERKRIRFIFQGCLITLIYLVITIAMNIVASFLNISIYFSLPSLCVLIWAVTIRYAMVKYDFLASAGRRYELLYDLSPNGIVLIDDQIKVIDTNVSFLKQFCGRQEPVGMVFTELFTEGEQERFLEVYGHSYSMLQPFQFETEICCENSDKHYILMNGDHLEIEGQVITLLVLQDMTAQKRNEERLSQLAYRDELTGLDNRRLFREKLHRELEASEIKLDKLAILLIDLDQFKWINDTLGHSAGDHLLEQVARRLEEGLLVDGVVARLGGDEFAVMLPHIAKEEEVGQYAAKLQKSFERPFLIYGTSYKVTVSIGISMAPYDGHDVETLLRNADTAMYVAKKRGRNQYYWFTQQFKTQADQHLKLANGLSHALAADELTLYYQPQIDIQSNKVYGVEALVRWNSAELGAVSPAVFIPIAEETGAILPIGAWVLRTAMKQAKKWTEEGFKDLVVSVNISAHQLIEPEFAHYVADFMQEYGLDARHLCLEITESAAISDLETSYKVCTELVELGVKLAIDDFGVGHSSLSMLNKFPFQFIKLDRSLVQDIATSSRDYAIIRTVIELSGHLGMQVVAEGVETREQAELLRTLNCPEAQGYLYGRPMPLEQITAYLRSHT